MPKFIRPFPDVFEWDLTMLKAMSKKYIDNTLLLDKRNDYWLTDGLQTYLMMNYVSEYYPEIKLAGNISKKNWFTITLVAIIFGLLGFVIGRQGEARHRSLPMIHSTNGMIKGDMKDMHMYMMKDLAGDVEWDQEDIKVLRELKLLVKMEKKANE